MPILKMYILNIYICIYVYIYSIYIYIYIPVSHPTLSMILTVKVIRRVISSEICLNASFPYVYDDIIVVTIPYV